jgi:Flp pilus assembly protein TadG
MKIKSETLNQSGASAIEFALVLPVLLLFLFGIIEFSVLFYNKAMITNASREAAREGIRYDWDTAPAIGGWTDPDTLGDVVDAYLGNMLITFSSEKPTAVTSVTDSPPLGHGSPRTVRVAYDYDFLILPEFADNVANLTLTAQTVMRLE